MGKITQKQADELQRQHQNDPPDDAILMEYGLRYHRECEQFDQIVCEKRDKRGIAVPSHQERRLVIQNAKAVEKRLLSDLSAKLKLSATEAEDMMRYAIKISAIQFAYEWDHNPQRCAEYER